MTPPPPPRNIFAPPPPSLRPETKLLVLVLTLTLLVGNSGDKVIRVTLRQKSPSQHHEPPHPPPPPTPTLVGEYPTASTGLHLLLLTPVIRGSTPRPHYVASRYVASLSCKQQAAYNRYYRSHVLASQFIKERR